MSPSSSCSGHLVIRHNNSGSWRGTRGRNWCRFECPFCGFVYYRPAPLARNPDGTFEYDFHRRCVAKWALPLKEIWKDSSQTWQSLSAFFSKRIAQIGANAVKLGLPDMPGRKLQSYRNRASASNRDLLVANKRAALVDFISKNPSIRYGDVPTSIKTLHEWLRRC